MVVSDTGPNKMANKLKEQPLLQPAFHSKASEMNSRAKLPEMQPVPGTELPWVDYRMLPVAARFESLIRNDI